MLMGSAALPGCQRPAPPPRAAFVRTIPWAGRGVWLKADTHVHTQFSDGGIELGEVVRRAYRNGCDVLAITDHADSGLQATSDEYFAALDAARQQYPDLIVLAGLEWNVPPWQGREHAAVLVAPGPRAQATLREFQARFDDWQRDTRDSERALAALRWLTARADRASGTPVVFYNHPSRKRQSASELVGELLALRAAGPVAVGFEGGPGHQDSQPIGTYQPGLPTIDRWDPAAAEVGGAWDQMLQRGASVWGALATSDFHNADPQAPDDYWPGEFSETWLYAENRTPPAALVALREGSFFGVHGHIAQSVQLSVAADGLPRPAIAGESIQAPAGALLAVTLDLEMPLLDWNDKPNLVDEVELIVVTPKEAQVAARQPPALVGPALQLLVPATPGGLAIRARGRRIVEDGPDLMFYTNPIQVVCDEPDEAPAGQADAEPATQPDDSRDRRMPAWIFLLFALGGAVLLSLLDRWRVEIGRRFGVGGPSPAAPRRTPPHTRQRYLLAALACSVFLAVYGSLVPLRWKEQTASQAARQFADVLQQPLNLSSKTDWATNVLLFVPIGFLATGVTLGRMSSDRRRMLVPPLVVLGCAALSLAVEYGQLWVVGRECSQNDIVAECLGGLLGAAAWLGCGSSVAAWLDVFGANRRPRQRLERLLEVYLLAIAALSLLPLDLTLRPAEIYHKWQEGRITLLPLADLKLTVKGVVQLLEENLLLMPLGVLAAIWRWPRETDVRPLGRSLLLGLAMLASCELAQLLVYSRHNSTTDLVTGLAGIAAGWGLARWRLWGAPLDSEPARRRMRCCVLAIAAVHALLLAVVFWLPFDRVSTSAEVGQRWNALLSTPLLAVFQQGEISNAVAEVFRKVLLFGSLGGLLATAALTHPARSVLRRRALFGAATFAALAAIGIEFGQLWLPPHVPDWSDVLLAFAGCGGGVLSILALTSRRKDAAP